MKRVIKYKDIPRITKATVIFLANQINVTMTNEDVMRCDLEKVAGSVATLCAQINFVMKDKYKIILE